MGAVYNKCIAFETTFDGCGFGPPYADSGAELLVGLACEATRRNFTRTERQLSLVVRIWVANSTRVRSSFRSIEVRHGAACLLEGISKAVPCFCLDQSEFVLDGSQTRCSRARYIQYLSDPDEMPGEDQGRRTRAARRPAPPAAALAR
jgi:hypothetical protein